MDIFITNLVAIAQGEYGGIAKFFLYFNSLLLIPFGIYLYGYAIVNQIKIWKSRKR
tara:strand:- start:298 stop:465 length:168 start_codon:yes stop_codon:yes gene_type:complete